jgi:TonB family protein
MFRSHRGVLAALILLAATGLAHAEVRLSTADAVNAAIVKPPPAYPIIAKQMHITGKVEVEVKIDAQGNVGEIKMLNGNALFSQAITDALKRWKFAPVMQGGAPSAAVAVLSFTFNE